MYAIKLLIIFVASSYFLIEIVKFKKRHSRVIEIPLTINKIIETVDI